MSEPGGRILVVDDEEVMRDVLLTLLHGAGYDVELAADGASGLALARSGSFDAAVVDVMLPDVSGRSTRNSLARPVPDISLSAAS